MSASFYGIPKYPDSANVPMKSTTARITEKQRAYLERIVKATNAVSASASLRLLTKNEMTEVNNGHRTPDDYIPTNDERPFTIGFKVTETDMESIQKLKDFYKARSMGDVVCHLMNQVIRFLDEKDGE